MSASQQKKLRQQQRQEGTEKHLVAQKKLDKALKRKAHRRSVIALVAIVFILLIIVYASGVLNTALPAVTIGDEGYSAAEFSFFYNAYINNFVTQNSSYLQYFGLDTSKSYASQQYSEDQTWADYFKETVLNEMQQITAFYTEAQKEGFKLSETDQTSLDANLEGLKTSNSGSDYATADKFLAATYGKGCTVELIGKLIEKSYIAQAYATKKQADFTYSQDDLKAYYAENKDDLDQYTYVSYFADGSVKDAATTDTDAATSTDTAVSPSASPETETAEQAMAKAKIIADAIVQGSDSEDTFKAAVFQQTQTDASESTTQGSSLSENYADWMKDASRKAGDTTVIETDTGYYALYYISRDDNSYKTVDVRHILIKAVASDDGTYSNEAKATAKQKAEDLLSQWEAGDKTEDSFSELAKANSEDTDSNANGGLYESVYKGQMVTDFNDWCFDPARKSGDTGIVYGESSAYAGYHVIYYVGQDKAYSDILAEDKLREKDYSDWQTALLENYPIKKGVTLKLVK